MFFKLMLVIICMISIFMFSSDNADESTKKSDSVIVRSCEFIMGRKLTAKEKEKYIDKFVFIVRKGAHFTIYLILGLAVDSFLDEIGFLFKRQLYTAVIICFLYAISDEIHQVFVPGRSCELRDVLIDTLGAYIGCLILYKRNMIRRLTYE